MQNQQVLTKNQKIVLDIIEKSSQPLKAYSILFDVKKKELMLLYKSIELWTNLLRLEKFIKLRAEMHL